MGELRQNRVTGTWVVVAPARGERPVEVDEIDGDREPPHDPECPFCPGNEHRLAELLWELPGTGAGWYTRAVSNLYPAFGQTSGSSGRNTLIPPGGGAVEDGFPGPLQAAGRQEVLIETPRHDLDPSRLSPPALRALIESYHRRYVHLASIPGIEQVFLFRNHRYEAGISLRHPHSQFVATAFTPPMVREWRERLVRHHRETSACMLCGIHRAWRDGPGAKRRRVAESDAFMALVPWAAESPCELWVIPLRHQADFSEARPDERADLAALLGRLLRAYRGAAGDPPYNYMIQTWGVDEAGSDALHWFLRILPRSVRRAGFEMGSGVSINPSSPELDARILREGLERPVEEGASG